MSALTACHHVAADTRTTVRLLPGGAVSVVVGDVSHLGTPADLLAVLAPLVEELALLVTGEAA